MSVDCPTCGDEMVPKGTSGRDALGRLQEVSWDKCPECETIVTDTGDVITKMDQIHDQAWKEYAAEKGDWSVIP